MASQFGRGDEAIESAQDRRERQARDRAEDNRNAVNDSTRPGQLTLAELKALRR